MLRVHIKSQKLKKLCPEPDCSFEYTDIRQLKIHRMTDHENIKGYSCPKCEYISLRADDAKKHLKYVHKLTTFPNKARWIVTSPNVGDEESPNIYELDPEIMELITFTPIKKSSKKKKVLATL